MGTFSDVDDLGLAQVMHRSKRSDRRPQLLAIACQQALHLGTERTLLQFSGPGPNHALSKERRKPSWAGPLCSISVSARHDADIQVDDQDSVHLRQLILHRPGSRSADVTIWSGTDLTPPSSCWRESKVA